MKGSGRGLFACQYLTHYNTLYGRMGGWTNNNDELRKIWNEAVVDYLLVGTREYHGEYLGISSLLT
jgi:hypothetical protein